MATKLGTVFLVGAGPGDPELLTIKAQRLISNAKTIVYDRLVSDEILALAPADAEMINVGKNAGRHLIPQPQINQILVDIAKTGRDVVRVQGGDCFMFGRGGEELELLHENSIPFEMVPGITSAFAAPIYAGIPITHRKFCSSVHVITGHKQRNGALAFDFDSLVHMGGTMIFLMAVSTVAQVAQGLLSAGMCRDMPCAVVECGTRTNQRSFSCQISQLEYVVREQSIKSPATIIVGEVCGFSDKFNWFESLPLFGKKILITRPKAENAAFAQSLKSLGASVVNLPAIKTQKMDFDITLALDYSCLVFTSHAGIDVFFDELRQKKLNFAPFLAKKIAVLGQKGAKIFENYGHFDAFYPQKSCAEALALELIDTKFITKSDKILLLRAEKAAHCMPEILAQNGIDFCEMPTYRVLPVANPISAETIQSLDFATFTSASCVQSFIDAAPSGMDFGNLRSICIGEQTAKAAQNAGLLCTLSACATTESMVDCILSLCCAK